MSMTAESDKEYMQRQRRQAGMKRMDVGMRAIRRAHNPKSRTNHTQKDKLGRLETPKATICTKTGSARFMFEDTVRETTSETLGNTRCYSQGALIRRNLPDPAGTARHPAAGSFVRICRANHPSAESHMAPESAAVCR
jgi:hypothetical protein